MRLTARDRALLIRALTLAIRDRQTSIEPDAKGPDAIKLNAEIMADMDKFIDLLGKLRRLTGKGE